MKVSHIILSIVCLIVLLGTVDAAKFLIRTIPTANNTLTTYFDGIYQCNTGCSKEDDFSLRFITSDPKFHDHIDPKSIDVEFFLDSDDSPIGKISGAGFNKDNMAHHKIPLNDKKYAASTLIRFAGIIHYKKIANDVQTIDKPSIGLTWTESGVKADVSAPLYYVPSLDMDFVTDVVYDDVVTKTYTLFIVAENVPFETNHFILRPFGALRNKPDFPPEQMNCLINSLPFKVKILKDPLGDDYYELTLQDKYRSDYHFPRQIDLSFQCTLGQIIKNDNAPFGIALSMKKRSSTDMLQIPTKFLTSKDISLIHWHQDFLNDFKILLAYQQYQSSHIPYESRNGKIEPQPQSIQLSSSLPQISNLDILNINQQQQLSLGEPTTFLPLTIFDELSDTFRTIYRSHYTMYYIIYGSNIIFDPKQEWLELKVQNTHGGKHISTQWSMSVEQWNSDDGSSHKEHFILSRGDIKPTKDTGTTLQYELIKPIVTEEVAKHHKFPYTLFSLDIELEFDSLPPLVNWYPANVALSLHKKVKKYKDQPLSLWEVMVCASYPYSKSWVALGNNFYIEPKINKEITKGNTRGYTFNVTLQHATFEVDEFSLHLPTQHYLFQGDFGSCTINGANSPGQTEWGETFNKGSGHVLHFKYTIKPHDTISITCPTGYLINALPLDKFTLVNNNIPMVIVGEHLDHTDTLNSMYAHANIAFTDHLKPSGHALRTAFIVILFIIIISAIFYIAIFKREQVLKCCGGGNSSNNSHQSSDLPYEESINTYDNNNNNNNNVPYDGYQAPQL